MRVSYSQLEAKLRKVAQASPAARQEALKLMVDRVVRNVVETAGNGSRDSNANINAWAAAGNSAGLGPFPIEQLDRSKRKGVARLGDWLRSAESYWGGIVASNEAKGRKGKWPDDAKRKLEQSRVKLAAFVAKNPNVISPPVVPGAATRGTTVLLPGEGRGEWQQAGDRTYLRLMNQRRGARFIEGKFRIMSNARAPFKKIGLTSMGGKKFAEKVALAAGLAEKWRPGWR